KEKEYKNSSKDWRKNHKSTMVFPIGAEISNISQTIENHAFRPVKDERHLIGFLCLDSNNTFEEDEARIAFDEAAKFMDSISDSLYPVLESFIVMQLNKAEVEEIECDSANCERG
ncbi:MAG: hypothetical protein FWD19_04650, partial [Defluviitaleaceae bacterium]|nr:hypothetical protein [Defluviitaleaceae bacterium]